MRKVNLIAECVKLGISVSVSNTKDELETFIEVIRMELAEQEIPECLCSLIEYIEQIRPDLTRKQVTAASRRLHEECECYLAKSKGHPSIMRAIYEAELTDEELTAHRKLDYDKQIALHAGKV